MSRLDSLPLPATDLTGGSTIITAGIGDGRGHQGVDWGTADGIDVGTLEYPVVAGTVVRIADDGPFRPPNGHTAGLNLWLEGDNGTRWKYFHTNKVLVAQGTHVDLGTPIAEVGHSGTQAAHLHLEEHRDTWSNFVNFEADARRALAAGRWPGNTQPMSPGPETQSVRLPEERAVARGDQFQFPDGTSYLLSVQPTDTGFGWIHIGGPKYLDQGRAEGLIADRVRALGQEGTKADDELFESHPVMTGPHQRSTHK